jgi:hypothetical protein
MFVCVILSGLLFSCPEFMPPNIEISGTLNVPLNIRVTNLNSLYNDAMEEAFDANSEETKNLKVYQVDYKGQTVEAFCVYIPIEITEDLNPDHFLRIINTQINDGLSAQSKDVSFSVPVVIPGLPIPVPLDSLNIADLPKVPLNEIARYVLSIDFDKCNGTDESGIGLNFNFTQIVDGIEMTIKCDALDINHTKTLTVGDNIFGNNTALTGDDAFLMRGLSDGNFLTFDIELKAADSSGILLIPTTGLDVGDSVPLYNGTISFFRHWTNATIDMHEAVKGEEGLAGKFPQNKEDGFDLSPLGGYFDGFIFEGLEASLYMGGSPIKVLQPGLRLFALYNDIDDPDPFFNGAFPIDSKSLVLDDTYISNGFYNHKHLPGVTSDMPGLNEDILGDIFKVMPKSLFFRYEIGFPDRLDVKPDMFDDDPGELDSSKVTPAIMLLLPLHLKATMDDSTLSFSDTFKGMKDLFNRDEPEELFSPYGIQSIKVTVEFLESMFSGGRLFLDGDKETDPLLFFPDGIKLDKKKMIVNFTKTQMEIVEKQLIKPNVWFKFKDGDEIVIPKNLGLIDINFEISGVIKLGELLE